MLTKRDKNIKLKKEMLSLTELCEILSISEATAKNWIKLKKIKPTLKKEKFVYFSKDYVSSVIRGLESNSLDFLKSRRNKKYVSGAYFYKDYISASSENIEPISKLINYIETNKLSLTESEINYIISDCAIQLFYKSKNEGCALKEYINNKILLKQYSILIDELIDDRKSAEEFINKYSEIFCLKYVYAKNEDLLGLLYSSLSNIRERKSKGAYYTPAKVVKKIVDRLDLKDISAKTIIDPCCGSGNFLIQLSDEIPLENIHGNDIDSTAIKITRINMALKYKLKDIEILYKNFTNSDFLTENNGDKYDYIIGNPPWGAELSKDVVAELKKKYKSANCKNIESYDVFIEKSLSSLSKNGEMAFVLPESILTVKTHMKIREIILNNSSMKYLEFLGNTFSNVMCPSIIFQLKKAVGKKSCVGMKVVNKKKSFVIQRERKLTSATFSFSMDDDEYFLYKKITDRKNKVYLKDNADFALGIVTGNNKKYVSDKKTTKNEVVLKGADIEKFKVKSPKNYIEYKPQNFQQVAPEEYYRAEEKLIYKFISKKLVFAYDNKQTLTLNSCNILIPRISGMNIKYVLAVLNSGVAQFVFEKQYQSAKVLRNHIESIPIPLCGASQQKEIVDLVDRILNTCDKKSLEALYNQLDLKITMLYGLGACENLFKMK